LISLKNAYFVFSWFFYVYAIAFLHIGSYAPGNHNLASNYLNRFYWSESKLNVLQRTVDKRKPRQNIFNRWRLSHFTGDIEIVFITQGRRGSMIKAEVLSSYWWSVLNITDLGVKLVREGKQYIDSLFFILN